MFAFFGILITIIILLVESKRKEPSGFFKFLVACGDADFGQETVKAKNRKKTAKAIKKQRKKKQHQTRNLVIAHSVAKNFNNILK